MGTFFWEVLSVNSAAVEEDEAGLDNEEDEQICTWNTKHKPEHENAHRSHASATVIHPSS